MKLQNYLQDMREPIPDWLESYKEGDNFSREMFFTSRVVYYPGYGDDGHAVKLFGSTHSAHCFVYTDYDTEQEFLEKRLVDADKGFKGYQTLSRIQLNEKDLAPEQWVMHIDPADLSSRRNNFAKAPFGFVEILERDEGLDDDHGPVRLAILFLGADGIATYDALFCQKFSLSAPFAVLIQDHGFGLNYDSFGGEGLMEKIASECKVFPQWLLIADGTKPWSQYTKVPDVDGDYGGMHCNRRYLYKLDQP